MSKVPINTISNPSSNWPAKLKNGTGERLKNWAAMLMGVAALVTASGTYFKPVEDPKYKKAYEAARIEIISLSRDLKKVSGDVQQLYKYRQEDEMRRRIAEQLETSSYEIEDRQLRLMLTKKYGKSWTDDYMDKRAKNRREIRQEYVKERKLRTPHFVDERTLPKYGEK